MCYNQGLPLYIVATSGTLLLLNLSYPLKDLAPEPFQSNETSVQRLISYARIIVQNVEIIFLHDLRDDLANLHQRNVLSKAGARS